MSSRHGARDAGSGPRIPAQVGDVVRRRDLVLARQLVHDDEAVDALHRRLFAAVLDERQHFEVEQVVDVVVVGRYYERFADHAVGVSAPSATW